MNRNLILIQRYLHKTNIIQQKILKRMHGRETFNTKTFPRSIIGQILAIYKYAKRIEIEAENQTFRLKLKTMRMIGLQNKVNNLPG